MSIWNVRAACSNNLFPANAVLNIPDLSGGCTCNYMPVSQAFAQATHFVAENRLLQLLVLDSLNTKRALTMKREDVLQKLAAGELSVDEANQLLAENEQKRGSLYCRVSQKGALSVYGLQRMPVTLYVEQWERLLDFADEIRSFAEEHKSELSRKK